TPECKGLTLPLAHSLTHIHATLRLTSFLTGPETTNFKTGVSERDNKRRTRNSCQVRSYCSNHDIASNTLVRVTNFLTFSYYILLFLFSLLFPFLVSVFFYILCIYNLWLVLLYLLTQPRTRMTVTVSLREAPDVAILATHRWPPGTCGPEPTDRHTTAAKIVRHLKRFSDMGRVGRE
ncbi:hypothetical protein ALC56_10632, partial [Trachymyrmex septentrionalis]